MVRSEFENIETFVLLDWLVAEFESRSAKYQLTGDSGLISRAYHASSQGRILLAMMKEPIKEIAREFRLDIDQETVDTEPAIGIWTSVTFLSFGVEANEIAETFALSFIEEIAKRKMSIPIPPLAFKIFYLPSLPVATADEGHIMGSVGGFMNIRKKRVEINVYPPRNYESIFKNIIHEIFHVCFLEESSTLDVEVAEEKVNKHVKIFFDNCKDEWKSNGTVIAEDLKTTIEKKLSVLNKTNTALERLHKELAKAKSHTQTLKEIFDAILYGEVRVTTI